MHSIGEHHPELDDSIQAAGHFVASRASQSRWFYLLLLRNGCLNDRARRGLLMTCAQFTCAQFDDANKVLSRCVFAA